MLILRCGTAVYDKTYAHDYGQIYGERAKKEGPLNHDLHGPYNYFSTDFHPYYHGTDMHTMQSVSKTLTSITFGIARMRMISRPAWTPPSCNSSAATKSRTSTIEKSASR